MGLTFGGKPASQVAVRSPQLGLPGVAETQRAERRAKESDRLERHIQAARWRGEQVAFLRERVRRLQAIQHRLGVWLDAHDWRHPLWRKRNARYWTTAHTLYAHEREMQGFVDKLYDLLAKKPAAQQERISAAYFQSLSSTPPAHRPARVGMMEP